MYSRFTKVGGMGRKDSLGLITVSCWLMMVYGSSVVCLAAVHDELPQCGLQGIYRQRQTLIESPNYPDNYPPNSCVDYVIRSPYRCPTKFHIQFLDFQLELSENCSRDYLAIGLENEDDDMAVLCGQVLGIRKYHTPDGILRLRFLSDDSPWTTNGGFRLLITRLACEREDLAARGLEVGGEGQPDEQDDTVEVNAKLPHKKPLHQHHHPQQQQQQQLLQFPQNFSLAGQSPLNPFGTPWPPIFTGYQPYPAVGYPPYAGSGFSGGGLYLPVAQQATATAPPCNPNAPQQQQQLPQLQQQQLQQLQQQLQQQQQQQQLQQQQQQFQQQLPAISDQYQTSAFQPQGVNLKDYDPQSLQQFGGQVDLCCVSSFTQAHFYLSSPGFPRIVLNALLPNQQRDCVIYLEKNSANVAGLRIQFKFFDFGQSSGGGGGIYPGQSSHPSPGGFYPGQQQAAGAARVACNGDFIELDGQRYCGCRSGHVHKSFWPEGRKALRLRMGQSGGAASNGFLLEIFQDQDTDSYRLDAGALGGGQNPTGLPGLAGLTGLNGLPGLGLSAYQPNLLPQLGLQPQLGLRPLYPNYLPHPAQLPSNYPLLPFTPYRQSRQASWQYARGLDAQQPARVVETNSTRKEFYYFDADEAFARAALDDEDSKTTSTSTTTSSSPGTISVSQYPNTKAFEQSSCSFDYMEVLRLTVDTLWLTKPICFAPVRSWFSNIFG